MSLLIASSITIPLGRWLLVHHPCTGGYKPNGAIIYDSGIDKYVATSQTTIQEIAAATQVNIVSSLQHSTQQSHPNQPSTSLWSMTAMQTRKKQMSYSLY